ncbi:MAG: hypothetical protein ACFNNL_10795 [Kingella oralis]
MDKLAAMLIAAATLIASGTAFAMTPKTVHYNCQGDKTLDVTYSFNKQNLPTKVVAKINGKRRTLPINLAHSDIAGTKFGKVGGYMIDTAYVDTTTYNQVTIGTVTAPNNRILYKECRPEN